MSNIHNLAENQNFAEARSKLFDKYYSFLNERQREAVYTVNGPLLILAGAGSGKTTVLVNRISHIIRYGNAYKADVPENIGIEATAELEAAYENFDSDGGKEKAEALLAAYAVEPCPAWAVLSITFTNKAANEMKERLAKTIGKSADEIWAGTFHSISLRILRKYGERAGYAKGFTIYDADDSKKLISQCMKALEIDEKNLPAKSVYNAIGRAKDKLISVAEYEAAAGVDFKLKQIAQIYRLYQQKLHENNVMDFDDIIMQTALLLKEDSEAREWVQHRFKYVCVDEYQDTNMAQFELIKSISGFHRNLMVVGDDDQSIYKFRGATIENILNFERDLKDAQVIKLEQNYRSTQNILNSANSIIRNNDGRRGKELWCDNGEGDKIRIKKLENQVEEAKYIINKIMEMVIREKRKYTDFAVLYRTNAQSNSLEQIFARSGVAYRVLSGLRFYDRKEIKDILAYLCVVNNTSDNLRLRRIINEPKRKIGEATVNAIELIANSENTSMFEIMKRSDKYTALAKASSKLLDFTYLIEGLKKISLEEQLPKLIEKTIELSGYSDMLIAEGEESRERLDNVQEIISNAVDYVSKNEDVSLGSFLEEVALVADIDNYDNNADAVTLMTIHSSKGLEFPVVFLPGMEEGLFPCMQSTMFPDDLEEERRLAYVAITRAKYRLFCTHVRERLLYGRTQFNPISRFLSEIPDEYIDTDAPKKVVASEGSRQRKTVISKEFFKKSELTKKAGKTASYERFEPGETVLHATFGQGTILEVKDMGSDTLYEIAFDTVGTKKLMATYAKLKKV